MTKNHIFRFPRPIYSVMVLLGLIFPAVGCHQLQQGHYALDELPGRPSAAGQNQYGRVYPIREGNIHSDGEQETAKSDGGNKTPEILGRNVRLVGYTEKNFAEDGNVLEDTALPQSFALGKVEWSEPDSSDDPSLKSAVTEESDLAADTSEQESIEDEVFMDSFEVNGVLPQEPISLSDQITQKISALPGGNEIPESAKNHSGISASSFAGSDEKRSQGVTNISSLSELPETNQTAAEKKNWHDAAQEAIRLLREEIECREENGEICFVEEAKLRLLLLTTGDLSGATEKIAGIEPHLQVFWEGECQGLSRFLKTESKEDTSWAEMVSDFQDGLSALKTEMPLKVKKSLFVKEPSVFGYYEETVPTFKPGDTINAYFELDNVVCSEDNGGDGCDIAVLCRRELINSLDQPVMETREKMCTGHSASQLNDIVLNLSLCLPEDLPSGTYKLNTVFLDRNNSEPEPIIESLELRVDP